MAFLTARIQAVEKVLFQLAVQPSNEALPYDLFSQILASAQLIALEKGLRAIADEDPNKATALAIIFEDLRKRGS